MLEPLFNPAFMLGVVFKIIKNQFCVFLQSTQYLGTVLPSVLAHKVRVLDFVELKNHEIEYGTIFVE